MQNIIHTRHKLFANVEECKNALQQLDILAPTKECSKCLNIMKLVIYVERGRKRIIYRCSIRGCQSKNSILKTNIQINDYLLIYFKLLTNHSYNQIVQDVPSSFTTFTKVRKQLKRVMVIFLESNRTIVGGENIIVQCDESVICRRGLIRTPTSTDDAFKDTVWILGCIDNTPERNFCVKKIANRRSETIIDALNGVVSSGSILHTDGYPSYPAVAHGLNLQHHIVNHKHGFRAYDGTHTNDIEGFWAFMKGKMRKEHGVMRSNIDDWLIEFSFYRKYILGQTPVEVSNIYLKLLKLLLK